jgi:hypothetical protein
VTGGAAESDGIDRLRRTPWQLVLLTLARPSVWLLFLAGCLAGAGPLALMPSWVRLLVSPLYAVGVVLPLCAWRMRVLDGRAAAEGRLSVPEPRLLPSAALDPRSDELRRTADGTLRRLVRLMRGQQVVYLAFAVGSIATFFMDLTDGMPPRWIWIPLASAMAVFFCWMALRQGPRFLAGARDTRDAVARGAAPRHVGRVVRVEGSAPVVAIAEGGDQLRVWCEWIRMPGVRPDDEVLVVGEWRAGAVVLVTLTGRKRPKSLFGDLKPAPAA